VKEEAQGNQNKLDLPVHPTVSTHLEPGISRIQAAGSEWVVHGLLQSQRTFMVELICQADIRQWPDFAELTQGQAEATPAQKRGSNLLRGLL
jgi:hypothetical protein